MTGVTYVVRKHYLPQWQVCWAVIPVIDGWPKPTPRAVFDGPTPAKRYCDELNHVRRDEEN